MSNIEECVGIDLANPQLSGPTFRDFIHRLIGSVRIYVLCNPHNPYSKFILFNIYMIDEYNEQLKGTATNNITNSFEHAVVKYLPEKKAVYISYNTQPSTININKIFVEPANLKTGEIQRQNSGKKRSYVEEEYGNTMID
jgi:hypothetical protein